MNSVDHGTVMTVRGPVAAVELGFCHGHEHLFNDNEYAARQNPDLLLDDFDSTMAELKLFKNCGGGCVVDAQPVGCGRVADWLVSVSQLSGVHIVASTGFHKLDYYPPGHWIHTLGEDALLKIFMREATQGMFVHTGETPPTGRVDAKPGVIKVALGAAGLAERYTALLSAAAKCSRQTGLPLLCHIENGRHAMELLNFVVERGVRPNSAILCHLDRNLNNSAFILEAAKTGAFVELDTIGRFKYHDDDLEAGLILGLLEAGLEDSIMLGLDTTRARMKSYGGNIGLDYIATNFIQKLKACGVSDEGIHKLMFRNPARALSIGKQPTLNS
jgi:5-phospho-D-xylono-1,4-lactonase